jgi:O-antigen/teichoic acid export membrane protein
MLDNNIVRRLLKGFGASLYGQAVVIVIQLAGVPILLSYWQTQLYGEWLILFAIPSYLSMTDLGFSQSAGNDMTARVARGDRAGALVLFQSLSSLVFFLAAVGLLLVGAAIMLLPLGSWMHFTRLTTPEVRWVLWFLAAEVLVKLTEGVSHAGFRANGDYALHVTIYYSTLFAQHASIWLLAARGLGPVAAAGAFFIIRAAVTPSVAVLLTRRHRWLHFGFAHAQLAQLAQLRALLRPALANTGIPLAQGLNVQGMVLLVGAILGPPAVVTFSTLRTLTRLALQLVFTVSSAAEPELAAAFGSGNGSLLRNLYQQTLRAGLWLALISALGLTITGEWILRFWTHGKVAMNPELFRWLLASAVASVLWWGSLTLLKSANRHLRVAVAYMASAGAAVVLAAFMLSYTRNLAMAGMSLLVMDGVMAAYALRAAARLIGSPPLNNMLLALNPFPLLRLVATKSHAY